MHDFLELFKDFCVRVKQFPSDVSVVSILLKEIQNNLIYKDSLPVCILNPVVL